MIYLKKGLLDIVLKAIHESGWNYLILSKDHPFKLRIYNEIESFNLKIIIYNITHGGYPRSKEEYRIQVKEPTLDDELGYKTLILGYWDEMNIFSGFDLQKHKGAPGYSSSMQVKKDYLEEAYKNGFSIYDKGNGETVVCFVPTFLVEYAKNLNELHSFGKSRKDLSILNDIANNSLELNDTVLENVTAARRTTIVTVKKKLRDSSFKSRVLTAYSYQCAICGIQLKLIDAAHILPVGADISTDETFNGVALCSLHHRAYDQALITFDSKYRLLINFVKMDYLKNIGHDGGKRKFINALKPMIFLPPDISDRPNVELIKQANKYRGWTI